MDQLESHLKAKSREIGFALAGIAPAADADRFDRFQDWLARGHHGEMAYLKQYEQERRHPRGVLETVRSVLMVALEYTPPLLPNSEFRIPNLGRVAAYAQGSDYHRVIWDKLNALAAWLEREVPGSGTCAVA